MSDYEAKIRTKFGELTIHFKDKTDLESKLLQVPELNMAIESQLGPVLLKEPEKALPGAACEIVSLERAAASAPILEIEFTPSLMLSSTSVTNSGSFETATPTIASKGRTTRATTPGPAVAFQAKMARKDTFTAPYAVTPPYRANGASSIAPTLRESRSRSVVGRGPLHGVARPTDRSAATVLTKSLALNSP